MSLNNLTAKEWVLFTKSWFILNPPPRKKNVIQHPAKYPEELVKPFVEFFTKKGEVVFDPFAGVGSTLVAAAELGRQSWGMELSPESCMAAACRFPGLNPQPLIVCGDALERMQFFLADDPRVVGKVDFIMTSPPYWNMLNKSRGGANSTHKERAAQGLPTNYGNHVLDLGQITDYTLFLGRLLEILSVSLDFLKPGGYMVVVLQNLRNPEGEMVPLAWDVAGTLPQTGKVVFKAEKLWLQDNKALRCWGYPSEFVTNVHHTYTLIFKKVIP